MHHASFAIIAFASGFNGCSFVVLEGTSVTLDATARERGKVRALDPSAPVART